MLLEHGSAAGGAQLVGLRIGELVFGGDPGIADQAASGGLPGCRRHGRTIRRDFGAFVQTQKLYVNGRLIGWPMPGRGRPPPAGRQPGAGERAKPAEIPGRSSCLRRFPYITEIGRELAVTPMPA